MEMEKLVSRRKYVKVNFNACSISPEEWNMLSNEVY